MREISATPNKTKALQDDHWFRVAERLAEESSEVPDPLQIRAAAILAALGIPQGPVSALTTNEQGKPVDLEKDRAIADLTNKAGVFINKKIGLVSQDFRDLYPKGLPEELQKALDPGTLAIMKIEYEHAAFIRKEFGDTENYYEADSPVHYFRLPGGVDLFLRGYAHNAVWQKIHGHFLERINAHAAVIAIEGMNDQQLGKSLDLLWSDPRQQHGHYDDLMHEAAKGGFKGFFTEVDARNNSKIAMDRTWSASFPDLPDKFFDKYFAFFQREHPRLAEILGSAQGLKNALVAQSTTHEGVIQKTERNKRFRRGREYPPFPYFSSSGKVDLAPTFRELGQTLFSDALAALKLHIIGKLMADGKLPKGPIIDYEGANHILSKSFFLLHPWYAAEVVLRTVNELMAGNVRMKGNLKEIYKVFENPDWAEVLREIVRLPMKQVENNPLKSVAIGKNQRRLINHPIDVLRIYNINPKTVMPTDATIASLRQRLAVKQNNRA